MTYVSYCLPSFSVKELVIFIYRVIKCCQPGIYLNSLQFGFQWSRHIGQVKFTCNTPVGLCEWSSKLYLPQQFLAQERWGLKSLSCSDDKSTSLDLQMYSLGGQNIFFLIHMKLPQGLVAITCKKTNLCLHATPSIRCKFTSFSTFAEVNKALI